MAGPRVTLAFEADTSDVRRDFDRVGDSARDMQRKVGDGSRDLGGGLDRVGEASDQLDTRMMGTRDLITGVGDTMRGAAQGDVLLLATGLGDLGSAGFNLVIPMLKQLKLGTLAHAAATRVSTIATAAFNAVMALNPVTLVVIAVAALVAGLILLFKNSDTARRVMTGAFNAIRSVVRATIGNAVDFAINRFQALLNFWRAVTSGIIDAIRVAANFIIDAFRTVWDFVQRVVGAIGRAISNIPGAGLLQSAAGFLGFQTGGIVPGPPGQSRLIMAHGGERITRASEVNGGGGGPIVVNLMLDGRTMASVLVDPIRRRLLDDGRRNVNVGLA